MPRTCLILSAALAAGLSAVPSPWAASPAPPRKALLGDAGYGDRSSPLANPAAMVERDYVQVLLSTYHEPGNLPGGQYLGIVAPIKPGWEGNALSLGVLGDWSGEDAGPGLRSDFQGWERTYQAGLGWRMPRYLPFSHQLAFGVNGFWHEFHGNDDDRENDFGLDAGLHWNPWYSSRKGELYVDAALHDLLAPFGVDNSGPGKRHWAIPLSGNASLLWRNPLRTWDLEAGLHIGDIDRDFGGARGYRAGGGVVWHPVRNWEVEAGYHPLGYPQVGGAYRWFKDGVLQVLEVRSRISPERVHIGLTGSLFTRRDLWFYPVRGRRLMWIETYDPDLPREGKRLFAAGRYELAATAYGRHVAKMPRHLHVDSSSFALGLCLGKLGFYELARDVFAENLRKYPDGNHTRLIADNHRELMRLDYLLGEYDTALARDSVFRELFPQSPFTPTFDFFSAQIRFTRGEFAEALPRFAAVPEGHRYYPQARHNLALCQVKMGNEAAAREILADLSENPASGDSDRDLRESARTKLGMLLYRPDPARAESVLARVDGRSSFRDEALVVRAWLAVRRSDFPRADSLAATVLDSLPLSVLAKEACFLRAYAAFRMGRHREARRLADSVVSGDWSVFFLPEEKALIERVHAESDEYHLRQARFLHSATWVSDRVGCQRRSPMAELEDFRRRHLRAVELKKRMKKAERYARSRSQVEAVAEQILEASGKDQEKGSEP